MATRNAQAIWNGTLKEGSGEMRLGSGAFQGAFTWASRFADGPGTNPEELIGAALAGCYSMFLSALLTNAGHPPSQIQTTATVSLERDDRGPVITQIQLHTRATVPGVSEADFQEISQQAKQNCPISRALAGPEITLRAELAG